MLEEIDKRLGDLLGRQRATGPVPVRDPVERAGNRERCEFGVAHGDRGIGDADLPEASRVQIYTYPADSAEALDLSILATAGSCGRRLTGRTVSSQAGQGLSTELSVVLPECDAAALPLHLKNLDQDVKLAAN